MEDEPMPLPRGRHLFIVPPPARPYVQSLGRQRFRCSARHVEWRRAFAHLDPLERVKIPPCPNGCAE